LDRRNKVVKRSSSFVIFRHLSRAGQGRGEERVFEKILGTGRLVQEVWGQIECYQPEADRTGSRYSSTTLGTNVVQKWPPQEAGTRH
jgi:hypothetical protein